MVRKKYLIILILLLLLVAVVGGASAAIALGLDRTVAVSYGEVSYTQSDLQVDDFSEKGPGVNTQEVDVTINNTANSDIDANVSVYLMDGTTVESSGSSGTTTFAPGETTVTITVDDTKEIRYDQVDIQLEET